MRDTPISSTIVFGNTVKDMAFHSLSPSPPPTSSSFIENEAIPNEIYSILAQHPIFANIHDENFLQQLATVMHPRFVAPGDMIVREGDEARSMFFVIKGVVQVQSGDGEVVFAELGRSQFFGEIALLFSVNRTATVCAKTKCVLARLSSEELQNILEKFPDVATAINNEAQKRFADLLSEMERAGKRVPEITFEGMQEKRKQERHVSKSSSAKSLAPSRRNSDLDIGNMSTSPSREFMYAMNVVHQGELTGERSIPAEQPLHQQLSASHLLDQKPIVASTIVKDPLEESDPSNDDVFRNANPAFMMHVALPDNEYDYYDDDDVEQDQTTDDEVEMFPSNSSEDSSTSSAETPPGSIQIPRQANPMLSAFASQNGGRRRASVAVWSDDKLMQLAANKGGSNSSGGSNDATKRKTWDGDQSPATLNRKRFAESIVQGDDSDADGAVEGPGCVYVDDRYGILGKSIMSRILSYLPFTTLFRIRSLNRLVFTLITSTEPNYRNLLSHIDLSPFHKRINDKSLCDVASYANTSVTSLNMRNCWAVTDKGLIKAAAYMSQLHDLVLASVWDITDGGLLSLARSCPNLTSLDLSNCRKITDNGVLAVLSACPGLTIITLSYCKNLSDLVLDHPQWRRVRRLDLQRCTGITDAGFERWRHPFTAERELQQRNSSAHHNGHNNSSNSSNNHSINGHVNSNDNPTPSSLSNSHINKHHNHLDFAMEELCLADCSFLTDNTITSISLSCHSLKVLSLSFCCALSESFATPLVTGCAALEELDMSFCGGAVTDSALQILGRGLSSSLDKLSIRGCIQVTDSGLNVLAEHALALRKVNVSNCKSVSKVGTRHWEPLNQSIFSGERIDIKIQRHSVA
ncbi:hypothetical protein SmJEL517_g03642 [Synchytrium microbalum]|uniref:Cyclic nucleotide-binding domain-containing protein n=1 Tax=Synchytrium microbalum TaxID=1806994 RepID=A0A507C7N0_9FUNG|nr:uncharacterized protein SmJEL517_g03642 [Synchytrium microbalum]TPX33495.1 hypothetical protein SmJEL517_g03642 [Synchytrium microbalum]